MNQLFFLSDATYHPQSHFVGVPTECYAITSGSSDKYSLFTCHVVTCFVVTLYDKETAIGALAHLSAMNPVKESVKKLTKNFTKKGIDLSRLEVQIIGGYSMDPAGKDQLSQLKSELQRITKNISEIVNTKMPPSLYKENEAAEIYSRLSEETDQEKKEKLIKEMSDLFKDVLFSQIALDTKTGVVSISTDYHHLVENPTNCKAFTKKGQRIYQITNKLVEQTMNLERKELLKIAKILEKPVKKVFNGIH